MLSKVLRGLFYLSILAMGGWVFLWPWLVSPAPDDPLLRCGAVVTLILFLCSLAGLSAVRIRSASRAGT